MSKFRWGVVLGALLACAAGSARAQSVVVYCGVNEAWCRAASTAFEQKTGVHVDMTRQSAGEIFARLRAEGANPRGDVWFGGTRDPPPQAAALGLTEEYKSRHLGQLQHRAQNQAKRSN